MCKCYLILATPGCRWTLLNYSENTLLPKMTYSLGWFWTLNRRGHMRIVKTSENENPVLTFLIETELDPNAFIKNLSLTLIILHIHQHALIIKKTQRKSRIADSKSHKLNWKLKNEGHFDAQRLNSDKALALKKLYSLYKRIPQPFPHLKIWQEKRIGPNTRPIPFPL